MKKTVVVSSIALLSIASLGTVKAQIPSKEFVLNTCEELLDTAREISGLHQTLDAYDSELGSGTQRPSKWEATRLGLAMGLNLERIMSFQQIVFLADARGSRCYTPAYWKGLGIRCEEMRVAFLGFGVSTAPDLYVMTSDKALASIRSRLYELTDEAAETMWNYCRQQ